MTQQTIPDTIAGMITRLGTTGRSSLAVTHRHTGYFAVTPQAPYDGTLSLAEQASQLLARAEVRLHEIGSSKAQLLFCAILLRDIDEVATFNAVWDDWIAGVPAPARACFAANLANPSLKVELIMICATENG